MANEYIEYDDTLKYMGATGFMDIIYKGKHYTFGSAFHFDEQVEEYTSPDGYTYIKFIPNLEFDFFEAIKDLLDGKRNDAPYVPEGKEIKGKNNDI